MEASQSVLTPQQQHDSPLPNLPGELRNKIYAYVIEDHITTVGKERRRNRKEWKKPALFLTCRLLHDEGMSLYYAQFAVLEHYEAKSKEWKTLTAQEALQFTLQPCKYWYTGPLRAELARGFVELQNQYSRQRRFYQSMCIERWVKPPPSQEEDAARGQYYYFPYACV